MSMEAGPTDADPWIMAGVLVFMVVTFVWFTRRP